MNRHSVDPAVFRQFHNAFDNRSVQAFNPSEGIRRHRGFEHILCDEQRTVALVSFGDRHGHIEKKIGIHVIAVSIRLIVFP